MSSSSFYVQRPPNAYWYVPSYVVIKASPINPQDETLSTDEKTNKCVQKYLKVEEPANYSPRIIKKSDWVKCEGPSRVFENFQSYVSFYHYKVDREHYLPLGWEIIDGEVKRKT